MNEKQWLIYGANGYTGRLIAEAAQQQGLQPILGGRNREELESLGAKLNLPTRIFPCLSPEDIAPHLKGVELVLHCAGPFSATSAPMVTACMQAKTHYLDITGEISVFENIHTRSADIARAGIIAIPGVGFDVVPTDCLAAMLKEKLADATELELILKPSGGVSPGTMKTMLEGIHQGTVIRQSGKIETLDRITVTRRQFRNRMLDVIGIGWGDVSTAFYTTGIPNIRVYMVTHPTNARLLPYLQKLRWLLNSSQAQSLLKKLVDWRVRGPDQAQREKSGYQIWGMVQNAAGQKVELGLTTTNGYTFTVDSALACVARILNGGLAPGAYTPAKAFGSAFVLSLPGNHL